jgi:capsular polysaccharide biosynthesis protein
MAVFTAVAMDILSGRVHESWQIERTLGLPVLGEAPLPRLAS